MYTSVHLGQRVLKGASSVSYRHTFCIFLLHFRPFVNFNSGDPRFRLQTAVVTNILDNSSDEEEFQKAVEASLIGNDSKG